MPLCRILLSKAVRTMSRSHPHATTTGIVAVQTRASFHPMTKDRMMPPIIVAMKVSKPPITGPPIPERSSVLLESTLDSAPGVFLVSSKKDMSCDMMELKHLSLIRCESFWVARDNAIPTPIQKIKAAPARSTLRPEYRLTWSLSSPYLDSGNPIAVRSFANRMACLLHSQSRLHVLMPVKP